MITFACRCSNRITVADEQAGESVQCPKCGILIDVPTIDDLPGLRDDGSYEFNDEVPTTQPAKPHAMRNSPSIMQRGEADRRLSLKEFLNIGTSEEDLLQIKDEIQAGVPKHPKYDPVTGELIVPIDVRKDVAPAPMMAIPMTLGYEHKAKDTRPSIFGPFWWMFRLPNLIVCGLVTLFFLFSLVFATSLLIIVIAPTFVLLLIAHFANVVDETGPTKNDEIPALFRSGNLFDDFLRPFCQVIGAHLVAISPIIVVNLYVPKLHWAANLGFGIFMFITMPAILLTMITSGAFNNLLPSRILSVITKSGVHYWIVAAVGNVALFGAMVALFIGAYVGNGLFYAIFQGPIANVTPLLGVLPIKLAIVLAPLVIFASMYLIHVYAWQLGLMYRLHHDKFDWVWQKHEKSERTDTQAQLHAVRQKQLQQQAAKARASMEQRGPRNAQGNIPVAKPVEPRGR